MTLSSRLVAGVLLVLALALLSSSVDERSTGRAASANAMGSAHDQTSGAPVPLLRPWLEDTGGGSAPAEIRNSTGEYKAISSSVTAAAAMLVAVGCTSS
jgi:hypothetical protein